MAPALSRPAGPQRIFQTTRMHTFFKSAAILLSLVLYSLVSCCLALLPAGRVGRRRRLTRNTSVFARIILRLLGIRVLARRTEHHPLPDRNYLIAANHLSYVDILVLAALRPAVFITSIELRNTFPLGMLAWFGGSIFVERRNPAGIKKEIRDIARTLQDGFSVVLFPEGTTSDGDTVRAFRNSLFTAAITAGTPVLPVCLRYRRINGQRVTERNRDAVYFYGGTTFPEHAPRLLAIRSVHVECRTLEPIATHAHQSRKDLAARCRDIIAAAYHRTS
jgi:1-acyl-sn-glycerol-3-phosphate acyltransferase